MRSLKSYLMAIAAMPSIAHAGVSDMDYVVTGGFTTYVNAFTRLKYIFHDSDYMGMVVVAILLALPIGAMIMLGRSAVQSFEGKSSSLNFGWLIMWLLGTVVFRGLMLPTSTIHIYDQERNQYQPVSNVPSMIVLTAGITNRFTQAFRDVITRNTATTTRTFGEGAPIKMLSLMLSTEGAPFESYLKRNVTQFWHDCSDIAEKTNSSTFDRTKLLNGSNRLLDDLAPLSNQSVYTVWLSSSSPSGQTITCSDAYTNIKSAMAGSAIAATSPFVNRIKSTCEKTGFTSSDAAQLQECASKIEDTLKDVYGDSALTLTTASQNVMLAQSISDSLLTDNPDAAIKQLVNRSMVNGAFTDTVGNAEWISEIKAMVVACLLAMMPILLILVATPLLNKALPLVLGLWIFVAAWDICDMMLLQAANDQIYTVMDELRRSNMGLDMLTLAPTATMKALSVMGSAREHAMTMATMIAGIFGVSAYTLQAMGSRVTANLDRASDKAQDGMTTEGKGALLRGLTDGVAEQAIHHQIGNINSVANGQVMGSVRDIAKANGVSSVLSGGNAVDAGSALGRIDAGSELGRISGINGPGGAFISDAVSASHQVGAAYGAIDASQATGTGLAEMSRQRTAVGDSAGLGQSQALLASGGSLSGVEDQSRTLTKDQTDVGLGTAAGHTAAANDLGTTVADLTKDTTYSGTALGGVAAERNVNDSKRYGGWKNLDGVDNAGQAANRNLFGDAPNDAVALAEQRIREQSAAAAGRNAGYNKSGVDLYDTNFAGGFEQVLNGAGTYQALQTPGAADGLIADAEHKTAQEIGFGNAVRDHATSSGIRSGEINAAESVATNTLFDRLGSMGLTDQQIADARAGKLSMAVNDDLAKQLEQSGVFNKEQVAALHKNGGVGTVELGISTDQNGNPVATTRLSTGNSTSIDNTYMDDQSRIVKDDAITSQVVEHNTNSTTGNITSDSRFLRSKEAMYELIKKMGVEEAGKDWAISGSQVLSNLVKEDVERSNSYVASADARVGSGSDGGWFNFNFGAGAQASSQDRADINTQRTLLQKAYDNIVDEAQSQKLSGEERNIYIASKAAQTFEVAYSETAGYAEKHTGDSSLTPLAMPAPPSAQDLGGISSPYYGSGQTLQSMQDPDSSSIRGKIDAEADHDVLLHRLNTVASNVVSQTGYDERDTEALTNNLAHAQNLLQQEADKRGLDDRWVNSRLTDYGGMIATAKPGQEHDAAVSALNDSGITDVGNLPPLPRNHAQVSGSSHPPINHEEHKNGVPGF